MCKYTVNDVLNERPCGSATPLVIEVENKLLPIIIVKEYEEDIQWITDNIAVGLKSTCIGNSNVDIYLMVLKFGEGYSNIYDLWFNYGYENHREFLSLILNEKRIVIDFRNENNERVNTIEIDNTINEHILDYFRKSTEKKVVKGDKEGNVISINTISKYKAWSEEEVFELMDKVFADYPSIEELWINF